jgi:hypothetical protein
MIKCFQLFPVFGILPYWHPKHNALSMIELSITRKPPLSHWTWVASIWGIWSLAFLQSPWQTPSRPCTRRRECSIHPCRFPFVNVVWLIVEFWEFFVYLDISTLLNTRLANIFCNSSFYPVTRVVCIAISQFITCFIDCAFGVKSENSLLSPMSWKMNFFMTFLKLLHLSSQSILSYFSLAV